MRKNQIQELPLNEEMYSYLVTEAVAEGIAPYDKIERLNNLSEYCSRYIEHLNALPLPTSEQRRAKAREKAEKYASTRPPVSRGALNKLLDMINREIEKNQRENPGKSRDIRDMTPQEYMQWSDELFFRNRKMDDETLADMPWWVLEATFPDEKAEYVRRTAKVAIEMAVRLRSGNITLPGSISLN